MLPDDHTNNKKWANSSWKRSVRARRCKIMPESHCSTVFLGPANGSKHPRQYTKFLSKQLRPVMMCKMHIISREMLSLPFISVWMSSFMFAIPQANKYGGACIVSFLSFVFQHSLRLFYSVELNWVKAKGSKSFQILTKLGQKHLTKCCDHGDVEYFVTSSIIWICCIKYSEDIWGLPYYFPLADWALHRVM